MVTHNVPAFANGLSAKLAAKSRHVCVFLGAGASRACGLPDMACLQRQILKGLAGAELEYFGCQTGDQNRNLEQILSRLRRIHALLDGGPDTVDGLTAEQAGDLDRRICGLIVNALRVDDSGLSPMLHFATWAARADYHLPVEVFTINYDLVLETAFESLRVPYFDGFVGALRARFYTHLVEATTADSDDWLPAFLVRVWKLHGSVNWEWGSEPHGEIVRLGTTVSSGSPAAIYPSDTKYDESRRVPFVVLQDRFRRAIRQPETLLLISGYSFRDEHLNEMIFDAAHQRPRSEFLAFSFDALPEKLAGAAVMIPNLQAIGRSEAIIGGVRGKWDPPPTNGRQDIWEDGGLTLGDFANLARYLAPQSPQHGDVGARLRELLTQLVANG